MLPTARFLSVIFLITFSANSLFAQPLDTSRLDNNPKLTAAESAWLNNHIGHGEFNFDGKYVAFSQLLTGGFYGIGKFMLPFHKKNVFHERISEASYQLYVLDEQEKKATNGYDAIIVFYDRKHKGKMDRLKREAVIADNFNRYPQIPAGAGEDSNPALSAVNAAFFNAVYQRHSIVAQGFDFSGKKVAIFNTRGQVDKIKQETIEQYVNRVKTSLDRDGFYEPEFTYILSEAQKRESGDYDLIIQYLCKKDVPVETLVGKLKSD
jgi:hypothetical protein